MDFVNLKGHPLDVSGAGAKKKTSRSTATGEYHKGFRAVGFSPDQLAAARRRYEQDTIDRRRAGHFVPPFDEEAWMNQSQPKPIRSKPYEVMSAAQACADIAAKQAGWKRTQVVPVRSS